MQDGGEVGITPIIDDFDNEGGGGNRIINISITAPLLDEHVVDEILPRLDEAFRRGERFKYLD